MRDPFADIRAKPAKLVVGLISGTSADGITGALVRITERGHDRPEIGLLGWATTPYPAEVRQRVIDLFTQAVTMQEAAALHFLLGELFADAARAAARAGGYDLSTVDLIASHGQTVAHVGTPDPTDPLSRASTLQFGEPAVIAERTRRPVIADFRPADMAAGGVGAPFVPYADLLLLGGPKGRIALNLGGISNLTVLPPGAGPDDVYAFDCGPANMVSDGLVRRFYGEPYDHGGARAARGLVRDDLLHTLMRHPFVEAPPPKAAGHEQFGRAFLEELLAAWGALPPEDLIATATAFAAGAIARNMTLFVQPRHAIDEIVAAGGGVHNGTLMRRLADAVAPVRVRAIDEFGIPADAKEAIAFALLGHASLMGRGGNLPSVTGARHAAVLGKFAWPPDGGAPEAGH